MDISFDPAKDQANRAKHGISLDLAAALDWSGAVIVADDRFDYGEDRFRAFGRIDGRLHVLVFTRRDGTIRAISLRKANAREVSFHDQS